MEYKKIGWKPNLFDLLVVVVALAAAAALVGLRLWQSRPPENAGEPVTVRYTVDLNEMTLTAAQSIQPGHELIEPSLGKPVGVVESVEVHPTRILSRDQNTGEQRYVEMPESYTATIVLTADASEHETNFTTENGLVVRVGAYVRLIGPNYFGVGYIVNMERSDGE